MAKKYLSIRAQSEALCRPLKIEDYGVQSMPDVSPPKWHLAHTTWFFERFLLMNFEKGYEPFDAHFHYLFNSYYKSLGPHQLRSERGLISRPTVEEVYDFRRHVDEHMLGLIQNSPEAAWTAMGFPLELGLHHEQQHQELLLMDIKHILFLNPLQPAYQETPGSHLSSIPREANDKIPTMKWIDFPEGLRTIGSPEEGFAFDNERPSHRVFLEAYRLASRPVTNGEYLEFIRDGGYRTPTLWLSDGWDTVLTQQWEAPLYWKAENGNWRSFTLAGFKPLRASEPVSHLSYYEADAFARWAGRRLPTEAEWEGAAAPEFRESLSSGNFLESNLFHPAPTGPKSSSGRMTQAFGDVWEWTGSAYLPYPRFRPFSGNFGEYNGKFMCSQMVLRGGSCATPKSHLRPGYRNFFQPHCRWQFSGVRLAENL